MKQKVRRLNLSRSVKISKLTIAYLYCVIAAMLESYCVKAQLKDGQDVLDLGCGWGSLCLFLAEKYPNSRIKALSNSKTQKVYIDSVAKSKGFKNLEVSIES